MKQDNKQIPSNEEPKEDGKLKKVIAELTHRLEVVESLLSDAKDVLTLEEAAVFMGMKKSTLYKLTHAQEIPYWKPNGKLVYFEKSELLHWIRQNKMIAKQQIKEEAADIVNMMSQNPAALHRDLR